MYVFNETGKIKNLLPSRAEGPAFLFSSASITSSGKHKVESEMSKRLRWKQTYWNMM